MKTLIIFGSKSDERIYGPIKKELKESDFKICSAHRTPDFLDEILKKNYDLIITGAGLAAHLPGVIASKTIAPILGVPCSGNFGGLDALLSIMQMPPGIPVLCVGVDNAPEAARNGNLIRNKFEKVNIIKNSEIDIEKLEKMDEIFADFNVKTELAKELDDFAVNINFVQVHKRYEEKFSQLSLVINIPVLENTIPDDATRLIELTKKGLWVGLNRFENAALAAVEILNHDGKYSEGLSSRREDMKKKILAMNE
ncbi:MAG: AIR carboxylase family protein [Nanoarchaeota archaeon]|nr:AIR carboxylase family protein [Nanoarchaeota archaeon]